MNNNLDSNLGTKISSKIIDLAKCELNKKETQDKIELIKDQIILYIIKAVNPYIICIILIMLGILCLQGYVVSKLINVHSEIKSLK